MRMGPGKYGQCLWLALGLEDSHIQAMQKPQHSDPCCVAGQPAFCFVCFPLSLAHTIYSFQTVTSVCMCVRLCVYVCYVWACAIYL